MHPSRAATYVCRWLLATALGTGAWGLAATPAAALEEQPGDAAALKDCEKRLCTLILTKDAKGDDLKCALAKSWPKTTLKGGESKLVKWGFGDARCEVDLDVARTMLHAALTEPSYALEIPEQKVRCEVESDGEVKKVRVALAPRIEFKDGKAHKVWVNLKDVSGPSSIKATVWAAANLEDSLGVFHKSMIKSINKFMFKQCAERHGPAATAGVDGDSVKVAKSAEEGATAKPTNDQSAKQSAKPAAASPATGPATAAKPATPAELQPQKTATPAVPAAAPAAAQKPAITLKFRNTAPWTIQAGE
ncbi:MAG: hypothetical protein ACT4N2_09885 [Hyphomicrobium sp.]